MNLPLPTELIHDILVHLPINHNLTDIGLAHKELLTPLLFHDVSFAKRHLHHQTSFCSHEQIIEDISSHGGWISVLMHYQALLFGHLLAKDYNDNQVLEYQELDSLFPNTSASRPLPLYEAFIATQRPTIDQLNRLFQYAAFNGFSELAELLLATPGVDPASNGNSAIINSAEAGHLRIVELLLQYELVDPAAKDNYAIGLASANGHAEVVRLLLSTGRVEPSADDSFAIRMAAANGHIGIMRLLLSTSDDTVDVTADDNFAIQMASHQGHFDVVQLLLGLNSVDPSANDNFAIRKASYFGHTQVVEVLLSVDKVDASVNECQALQSAAKRGHTRIVELLLADKKVNAAKGQGIYLGLLEAVGNSHVEVAHLFSKHARIGVSEINRALEVAAWDGQVESVRYLLMDERINDDGRGRAICCAARCGQLAIVRLLTQSCAQAIESIDSFHLAFALACDGGHLDTAKFLAEEGKTDPKARSALERASENGHAHVVAYLLDHCKVDPAVGNNAALRYAAKRGHLLVVRLLLATGQVDVTAIDNHATRIVITELLQEYISKSGETTI
ncbi:UNVERIFIED_CONTAM: hypothetical protein HDU68_012363 [Siphonaria sp. JEL0065]|nr:hypothetical protein HDU68_012363 [Siphonaria sp. JEL0065]